MWAGQDLLACVVSKRSKCERLSVASSGNPRQPVETSAGVSCRCLQGRSQCLLPAPVATTRYGDCLLRRESVPRQPIGFVDGLLLSFNVFADMVWCLPSGNPPATTSADRNVQDYVWPASYRKLHICWPQWQLCKLQCRLLSHWTPYICFTSELNADRFGTAQSQICYTQCAGLPHVDG